MTAVHDSFAIARTYPHSPARVFAAFSSEAGKQKWFSGPNPSWDLTDREFDFRVGGIETIEGRWKSGTVSRMELVYHDIVPDARIVYAYAMLIDGRKISVSLTSIELAPEDGGTRFLLTEHGIYLDGYEDKGSRLHGTTELIDRMGASLG